MSYLDRLKAKIAEIPVCEEPTKPTEPSFVSFVGEVDKGFREENAGGDALPTAPMPVTHIAPQSSAGLGLAPDISGGLERLRIMRRPRIKRPELWDEIKADALRIATDGWGSQAIALGWEPLHLFGYQPSDDPDDCSLAVELAGRSIVAVDADRIYLRSGDVRSFFEKRERPLLTRYLWDFDR